MADGFKNLYTYGHTEIKKKKYFVATIKNSFIMSGLIYYIYTILNLMDHLNSFKKVMSSYAPKKVTIAGLNSLLFRPHFILQFTGWLADKSTFIFN